uniref:Uncharacterized protein n=1 Tax=Equus asinus TaxID=9793 RepID=A0A9L0JWQ1_EQUAS
MTEGQAAIKRKPLRGVIGLWKFSPFLPLSILVLYQACILQVVPFRSALESLPDPAVLPEEESRLLLAALVKDYVRMKVRALEQETEGASGFLCGSRCLEVQMGGERAGPTDQKRITQEEIREREGSPSPCPEGILQHCHLCDPMAGRLAEQFWGWGEEQLRAHRCGLPKPLAVTAGIFRPEQQNDSRKKITMKPNSTSFNLS